MSAQSNDETYGTNQSNGIFDSLVERLGLRISFAYRTGIPTLLPSCPFRQKLLANMIAVTCNTAQTTSCALIRTRLQLFCVRKSPIQKSNTNFHRYKANLCLVAAIQAWNYVNPPTIWNVEDEINHIRAAVEASGPSLDNVISCLGNAAITTNVAKVFKNMNFVHITCHGASRMPTVHLQADSV
jgi:hypothetical protein